MEKILIYPYSNEYEPFVAHQKLFAGDLSTSRIESLVSPRGWGLESDVVSRAYGDLTISCDFAAELERCTVVWFVEDGQLALPENLLFEKLTTAISAGKKIIYTRVWDDIQYNKAISLIPKGKNITPSIDYAPCTVLTQQMCYKIETPVLVVFGLEENTDKFEIQIELRDELCSRGYVVSSISTRRDSEILGMHTLPSFMLGNEFTETQKIISYNHYVKQIEVEEKPDIIIVGVPGGVVSFDRFNHNNYGVMAFEISNAVPCDCAIMCLNYAPYFTGDCSEIIEDVMNRYGFDTECCHMAAVAIDTRSLNEDFTRKFLSVKKEYVQKLLSDIDTADVLDLTGKINLEIAVDRIITKLESYC